LQREPIQVPPEALAPPEMMPPQGAPV